MRLILLPLLVSFPLIRGSLTTRPTPRWDQRELPSIKEPEDIPRASSSKPFLPFSDLGAPAGPVKINNTFNHPVPSSFHHSTENGIYTTLDKLQKSSFKKKPQFNKKLGENLGGLTPEEIFYIDKDIIIIKGGDFRDSAYEKARLISKKKLEEQSIKPFKKFSLIRANDLNDKSSIIHPSSSQFPTSQLALFLPSLQVPEQSQRFHQYTYHPNHIKNVNNYSYFPPRKSYYPSFVNNPFAAKYKYTSSLTNNLENNYVPYFFHKPAKRVSNLIAPFPGSHSFTRDTDVNYRFPLPPSHPDAEWFINNARIKRK